MPHDGTEVERLYWTWVRAQVQYEQAIGRVNGDELMRLHERAGKAFERMSQYGRDVLLQEELEKLYAETTQEA